MGAPQWKLVQAFLREATEDEDFKVITAIDDAYAKLRTLQRGHFERTVDQGTTLIESIVANKRFNWTIAADLSAADVMALAETALQLLESAGSITAARTLLRRRKSTRSDFRYLRP